MIEMFGIITTILAVAGAILNNRKLVVCFYLWMVSNAISCCIHIEAGLWSLAVRDAIFFVLAIEGIIKWRNTNRL